MRTTIILPDGLAEQAKSYAAERGCSFTALVVDSLHLMMRHRAERELAPLPTFGGDGRMLIDLADKDALWDALDADGRR